MYGDSIPVCCILPLIPLVINFNKGFQMFLAGMNSDGSLLIMTFPFSHDVKYLTIPFTQRRFIQLHHEYTRVSVRDEVI